jgi:hypothetical protein
MIRLHFPALFLSMWLRPYFTVCHACCFTTLTKRYGFWAPPAAVPNLRSSNLVLAYSWRKGDVILLPASK